MSNLQRVFPYYTLPVSLWVMVHVCHSTVLNMGAMFPETGGCKGWGPDMQDSYDTQIVTESLIESIDLRVFLLTVSA